MSKLYDRRDAREFQQWAVGGFLVILVLFGWALWAFYLQYALGYATRPARLNSAERVEAMSARMNNEWMALQASEREVALRDAAVKVYAETYGEDTALWPQGKRTEYQQDRQHYANAVAAYNRACTNYMAVYADEYRAVAAPKDLPKQCILR